MGPPEQLCEMQRLSSCAHSHTHQSPKPRHHVKARARWRHCYGKLELHIPSTQLSSGQTWWNRNSPAGPWGSRSLLGFDGSRHLEWRHRAQPGAIVFVVEKSSVVQVPDKQESRMMLCHENQVLEGHLHCAEARCEMTGKPATLDFWCPRMLYLVPREDVTRPLKSMWLWCTREPSRGPWRRLIFEWGGI